MRRERERLEGVKAQREVKHASISTVWPVWPQNRGVSHVVRCCAKGFDKFGLKTRSESCHVGCAWWFGPQNHRWRISWFGSQNQARMISWFGPEHWGLRVRCVGWYQVGGRMASSWSFVDEAPCPCQRYCLIKVCLYFFQNIDILSQFSLALKLSYTTRNDLWYHTLSTNNIIIRY